VQVFEDEVTISSVVHLAGLKAVGESVEFPSLYYDNKYPPTTCTYPVFRPAK